MKSYKVISLGLLVCLISLYFISGLWGVYGVALGGYSFPVGVIISLLGIFQEDKKETKDSH